MPTGNQSGRTAVFPVSDYDLDGTLESGQAFRWEVRGDASEGVIGDQWVRLKMTTAGIHAEAAAPQHDWHWLEEFLQIKVNIADVLQTFPDDEPMRCAVASCRGLRLLRQQPWECLASFILSSTKQIVQIREIVRLLTERFGRRVIAPSQSGPTHAFPSAERIAACSETELRACKMGFRAPYLLKTAQMIVSDVVNLEDIRSLPLSEARERLLLFPGVGRKIADCVLLFGYGFPKAFPVDVWIMRALRELYFPQKRKVTPQRILEFSERHFGPYGGYAQQYLFHYMRTKHISNNRDKAARSAQ